MVERGPHGASGVDVCVVGHVTKDIIRVGKRGTVTPGGTAFYTSMGLKQFGLRVAVVTKTAMADEDALLRGLEDKGVAVICSRSKDSTVFENIYSGQELEHRRQRILAVAASFSVEDIDSIAASIFHVGPLTRQDIPTALLKQLGANPGLVSLDVQGMLRPTRTGEIREEDWPEKESALRSVDILKADKREALVLSGEKLVDEAARVLASYGPREVIITMGSGGSLVYAGENLHTIPCCRSSRAKHPTGCGDTYMAAYIYQRIKDLAPEVSAKFAAAAAALKLENPGPLRGKEADVWAVLT
jgi:sugar/nucleoside kinase (ribokinase family)